MGTYPPDQRKARRIGMWLLRETTSATFKEIGAAFGVSAGRAMQVVHAADADIWRKHHSLTMRGAMSIDPAMARLRASGALPTTERERWWEHEIKDKGARDVMLPPEPDPDLEACPECARADRVESAEGMDRLAGQRACRWWCERCNFAFSEIEDD